MGPKSDRASRSKNELQEIQKTEGLTEDTTGVKLETIGQTTSFCNK